VLTALLLATSALAIPSGLSNWQVLHQDQPWIGHTQARGLPWARSVFTLPAPQARVVALLSDFAHYPDFMERVSETRIYAPDVVHIILDMPFPIASRDYVVKYTRRDEGEAILFDFVAVEDPHASPVAGSVRLPRAEGQWKLEPDGQNATKVTYTWNGELLGDFPDWALTRAWATQGEEVMRWLEGAL
jgi:hypothetical protein